MKFDGSKEKQERLKAVEALDQSVLNQKINFSFPDGEEEIAALLTFLPEKDRMPMLRAFVESMLQQ